MELLMISLICMMASWTGGGAQMDHTPLLAHCFASRQTEQHFAALPWTSFESHPLSSNVTS